MSDFWEDVENMTAGDEVRVWPDGEDKPAHGIVTALDAAMKTLTMATFAGRSVVLKFKNRPEPGPE